MGSSMKENVECNTKQWIHFFRSLRCPPTSNIPISALCIRLRVCTLEAVSFTVSQLANSKGGFGNAYNPGITLVDFALACPVAENPHLLS
jgi:hypothetical protein